jgi:hypothetical protein
MVFPPLLLQHSSEEELRMLKLVRRAALALLILTAPAGSGVDRQQATVEQAS